MTSREIAELTGKDHKHVLTDIRSMLTGLGLDSAGFAAQYQDSTGRSLPMFVLPKSLTLTLASGYKVVMRKAIIDRWMELEAGSRYSGKLLTAAPPIPAACVSAVRGVSFRQTRLHSPIMVANVSGATRATLKIPPAQSFQHTRGGGFRHAAARQ
jgi:hypothetical protein